MYLKKLLSTLGPGLLYAGAAIGVSHLVQSTRAGADYAFDLVWVMLLANALKYPFFEFGPRFASATGKSLIEGYQAVGRWALLLFGVFTVLTMFIVQAAVTIVTAGIAGNLFHIPLSPAAISAIILGATTIILMIGRYKILDRLIKVVILVLAVSTIVAVISSFSSPSVAAPGSGPHFDWTHSIDIFFLIAFIGWMPAPIDVSVWQSLWTLAKRDSSRTKIRWKDSRLDFNIGYIGTGIMALCFLTLGARIMNGSEQELSSSGVIFSGQLISMYTTTIGQWAYFFIALAALTTMFSTTLTVVDAFPRVLEELTMKTVPPGKNALKVKRYGYWTWLVVLVAGTVLLLTYMATSMRFMVDLATTLSFITAPVLAYLNYKAVMHPQMPREARPEKWLRVWAWIGIAFLSAFTVFYLVYRLIHII